MSSTEHDCHDELIFRFQLVRCPGAARFFGEGSRDLWIAQVLEDAPEPVKGLWGAGVCGEHAIIDLMEQWLDSRRKQSLGENVSSCV